MLRDCTSTMSMTIFLFGQNKECLLYYYISTLSQLDKKTTFFIFIFILLCALYLFLQELLYIHVQRQCNLRAELTSYYFILKKQNMSKQHSEQNILVLNHHSNNLFLLSLFSISNRTLFLNSLADSLPSCGNPAIKLIWRAGISKR